MRPLLTNTKFFGSERGLAMTKNKQLLQGFGFSPHRREQLRRQRRVTFLSRGLLPIGVHPIEKIAQCSRARRISHRSSQVNEGETRNRKRIAPRRVRKRSGKIVPPRLFCRPARSRN